MTATHLPPAATALVGRDREIDQVADLLTDPGVRLLTLTGPGGVGKTQLSLAVAQRLTAEEQRTVTFVALASLSDPDLIAPAIGLAFGLHNADARALPETLGALAGDCPRLLLLDNFEHLIDAAPLIVQLVQAAPMLQVLVTSRVLLRLSIEREFPVQPLPVRGDGTSAVAENIPAAIELFSRRAGLKSATLSTNDRQMVTEICRRTDGLPLAIELAAAKSRLLSLPELLARMNPALPLLVDGHRDAPGRLQTMQSAIAWSYDLLDLDEQRLFCALSVFSGGFTIPAAEAVAGRSETLDILSGLQTLLDHSLIHRESVGAGEQRYSMLETMREFGLERLAGSGMEREIREAHAAWFTRHLPSQPVRDIVGVTWHEFLFPGDQDNLRSALQWLLIIGHATDAALIAFRLTPFWWRQGYFSEARDAYARIIARVSELPPAWHSEVYGSAAEFAMQQSDFALAGELAEHALKSARSFGDEEHIRWHLRQVAWYKMVSDPVEAVAPAEEIVEISERAGDFDGMVRSLCLLAMCKVYDNRLDEAAAHELDAEAALSRVPNPDPNLLTERIQMKGSLEFYLGHFDEALPLLELSLSARREQGNRVYEMHCLRDIGRIYLAKGDRLAAADRFAHALELAYLLGSEHGKSYCFEEAAATGTGEEDSARLLGAAAMIRERLRLSSIPTERALREETSARLIAAMGKEQFESAFNAGKLLTSLQAHHVAQRSLASAIETAPLEPASVLTLREREVLQLISEGKSDREIGELLFISRRTAATHVSNILAKLGVHSRAEATAWAVRQNII